LVLSGLVKRRALLAGELDPGQAKARQLHADLAALDAVIRQLDLTCPVDAIATKRARGLDGAKADMGRTVLDVLRQARAPLTIAAVAERVIAIRGLDAGSGAVRTAVEGHVGRALRYQREKGAVRSPPKKRRTVLWELAG